MARAGRGSGVLAITTGVGVVLGGLGIEAAFGYPQRLFQLAGHPVTWIGALISRLDRALNRASLAPRRRRLNGVAALALLVLASAAPAALLQDAAWAWLPRPAALAVLAALASTLLAQRSLWTHVRTVADALDGLHPLPSQVSAQASKARGSASGLRSRLALRIYLLEERVSKGLGPLAGLGRARPCLLARQGRGPLPAGAEVTAGAAPVIAAAPGKSVARRSQGDALAAGRTAVARIVGRDVAGLDEAGVVRAAIESLAENFSDAVVAPALWGVAAGLPGLVFYKAVNTADSMIGHRTARHETFGWAAARLDDWINLPASRLAALWIVLAAALHRLCGAACSPAEAARAVWRDAGRHRSPNAGWPEAAMAGALGLRLAGPRAYGGAPVADAWMGQGRAGASVADLRRALAVYRTACVLQAAVVAALLLG